MPSNAPQFSRLALRPLAAAFALALALDATALASGAPDAPPHTLVVGNCDDSGAGSLRDAVDHAADGDTIDLSQLACSTITLSTGAILIGVTGLTLHGPGNHGLVLSGAGDSGAALLYDLGGGLLTIEGVDLGFGSKYRSDNNAHGGCVYTNGDLDVRDSHVYFCGVHAGSYTASGGALYAQGSVSIDNVFVDTCGLTTSGTARGGGIFAGTDLIVTNSRVSYCRNATSSQGFGGGVYAGGNLIMKYSTISDNENSDATTGIGGGVYVRGDSTIYWSTIAGNTATVGGGIALAFDTSRSALIAESTVSGNYANAAGGIAAPMPIEIENSTIAFNRIPQHSSIPLDYAFSAGLAVRAGATLTSTIVANNVIVGDTFEPADIGGDIPIAVGGASNLVMDSAQPLPPDTLAGDPRLAPLADNGGPTPTHALFADSPAIDHGADGGFASDQRGLGFDRVIGAAADIGAYESNGDVIFTNGFD